MKVSSFRDLDVWNRSIDLLPKVYQLLRQLPVEERFALADQIRRACVSIPANIAEGHARQHRKEYVQSLFVAKGSLAELQTLLVAGRKLDYFSSADTREVELEMEEIAKMLNGLVRSLRRRISRGS